MNVDAWYLYTPPGGWSRQYYVPCKIIKVNRKRTKIECKHGTFGWNVALTRTVDNHLLILCPTPMQVMNELMVMG